MKKNILYAALGIILIGLIFSIKIDMGVNKKPAESPAVNLEDSEKATTTESLAKEKSQDSERAIARSNSKVNSTLTIPDQAWAAFEEYLMAYKNHDVTAIKRISYNHKFGAECLSVLADKADEKQKAICFSNIDRVYKSIPNLNKSDFPNILSDSKQIILFSNPKIIDDAIQRTSYKKIIYFVIDGGVIKPISIDLNRSLSVDKNGMSEEAINEKLLEKTKDSDKDSIEDVIEDCVVKTTADSCVSTDPQKRDSDGDGFWDSMETRL